MIEEIQQRGNLSQDLVKSPNEKILILGVGNYLMGDEGVGVHLAQKMEKMDLPEYLKVVDGGTGGFFLMNYFDEFEKVIFVDATMDGKPPGTISLIKPRFAADFPKALSVHDVGLKDMVETLYMMGNVPEMHLFTVSIAEIVPMHVGLSQPVDNVLELLAEKILNLGAQLQQQY